jgi:hypothetical protein
MIQAQLPLAIAFLPPRGRNFGVVFDIAIKVPFFNDALDILEDFWTSREEVTPVWIRVEWKCLEQVNIRPKN